MGRFMRLFGRSGGADSIRDRYDPVYGLPRLAVEEWLAHNPKLREEYEAVLRARAVESGADATGHRYAAEDRCRAQDPATARAGGGARWRSSGRGRTRTCP